MTSRPDVTLGQNFIAGQWSQGQGAAWERSSPADEGAVWCGNWSSTAQTVQALEAAHQNFATWSETKLEERINICKHFAQYVGQHKEELAPLIAIETGKPLWEARTEVAAVIAKVANSIDAILKRRWTTTDQSS